MLTLYAVKGSCNDRSDNINDNNHWLEEVWCSQGTWLSLYKVSVVQNSECVLKAGSSDSSTVYTLQDVAD